VKLQLIQITRLRNRHYGKLFSIILGIDCSSPIVNVAGFKRLVEEVWR